MDFLKTKEDKTFINRFFKKDAFINIFKMFSTPDQNFVSSIVCRNKTLWEVQQDVLCK